MIVAIRDWNDSLAAIPAMIPASLSLCRSQRSRSSEYHKCKYGAAHRRNSYKYFRVADWGVLLQYKHEARASGFASGYKQMSVRKWRFISDPLACASCLYSQTITWRWRFNRRRKKNHQPGGIWSTACGVCAATTWCGSCVAFFGRDQSLFYYVLIDTNLLRRRALAGCYTDPFLFSIFIDVFSNIHCRTQFSGGENAFCEHPQRFLAFKTSQIAQNPCNVLQAQLV